MAGALLLAGLAGCSTGPDDDEVRLLLIGDSITQGKAGDWTWRYRLWQQLQSEGESDVDLVGPADDLRGGSEDYRDPDFDRDHAAQWGATLSPPVYDPEALGRAFRPDVAVIELGVNDLVHVPLLAFAGVEELNQRYDDLAADLDTEDERGVVALADLG
jgi:lysophospholipase L1-like esterase